MIFRMVQKSGEIFLPFCHKQLTRLTDKQTDGQNYRYTASAFHAAR